MLYWNLSCTWDHWRLLIELDVSEKCCPLPTIMDFTNSAVRHLLLALLYQAVVTKTFILSFVDEGGGSADKLTSSMTARLQSKGVFHLFNLSRFYVMDSMLGSPVKQNLHKQANVTLIIYMSVIPSLFAGIPSDHCYQLFYRYALHMISIR